MIDPIPEEGHHGKHHDGRHRKGMRICGLIMFAVLFTLLGCCIGKCCMMKKNCMKKHKKMMQLRNVSFTYNCREHQETLKTRSKKNMKKSSNLNKNFKKKENKKLDKTIIKNLEDVVIKSTLKEWWCKNINHNTDNQKTWGKESLLENPSMKVLNQTNTLNFDYPN